MTSQYDGTELDAAAIILNNLQVECDLPEILYSDNNLIDFRCCAGRSIASVLHNVECSCVDNRHNIVLTLAVAFRSTIYQFVTDKKIFIILTMY